VVFRLPSDLAHASLASVLGVAFDIDDTFSSDGKITDEAFSALWNLHRNGIVLLPVTGRPAGWCDHIARFWPVDAVVGENGGFVMHMSEGKLVTKHHPLAPLQPEEKLHALHVKLQSLYPDLKLASDQSYRIYDLALDFAEDVKPVWSEERVKALVKSCEDEGAHAKISSIHVNTWFGNYDKRLGFRLALELLASRDPRLSRVENWAFLGDSPNDAPMFKEVPLSVGVRNVEQFLSTIATPPRYITKAHSGEGFKEFSDQLIRSKKA